MAVPLKHTILSFLIAGVWLVNGLVCKILNMVPRHEQIVAGILGNDHAGTFVILIGLSEILMAAWVITGFMTKLCAIVQMIVVAVMNVLEFILVPDLLLWGRMNAFFAAMFIGLIFYNEFVLNRELNRRAHT